MLWLCNIVFVFCLMTVGCSEDSSGTKCIPLKDCPYAMNMVYAQKYSSTTIEFLKKSDCGYSTTDGPLVQCPAEIPVISERQSNFFDCTTCTGKKGKCKNVNDCRTIRNTFVTMKDFEVCKQSNDNEGMEMKICCFEPQQLGFDMQPPNGYSPQLIPIEESTLQEFIEPASVKIVSNDLNQHDTSTDHPNIYSTSTAPHEMNQQDANTVYQNFLNGLNQQVGESDSLKFAIINETKISTLINSKPSETPKGQGNVNFEDSLNTLNTLVPQKPATRQFKGTFSDFSEKINQKRSENEKPKEPSPTMVFPEDSQEENVEHKPEILRSSIVKEKGRLNKHPTNRILHSANGHSSTNLKISRRVKRELKDEVLMSVRLVNQPQSAQLRPLTLTPKNSQAAVSANEENEDLTVHHEMTYKSRNIEAHKIVPQHAKLRPLNLAADYLKTLTDRVSPNQGKMLDILRILKTRKIVSPYAKLRPLTLTAENGENAENEENTDNAETAELVKDINKSNQNLINSGERTNTLKDLWTHQIVPQFSKLKYFIFTGENSKHTESIKRKKRNSIIRGKKAGTSRNLKTRELISQYAKLRPLTLTADNADTVKDTIHPNESNKHSIVRRESLDTSVTLKARKIVPHVKLRSLTLTRENSKMFKTTKSPKGNHKNSKVHGKSADTAIHVDPNIVLQQAKLRPLTLTAENSEIAKDTVSSNGNNEYSIVSEGNPDIVINLNDMCSPNESNKHLIVGGETLDTVIHVDPYNSIPHQANLRPLTLTAENSEIVKDTVRSNGSYEYSSDHKEKSESATNLESHKSDQQRAKLRPLTLTADNSEMVKDTISRHKSNKDLIDLREKSDTFMILKSNKSDPQLAKLRPLTLTAINSEIIKDQKSPNKSNEHLIVLREKFNTAKNLEPYKSDRQGQLRPLTLTEENSEIIKDTISPNKNIITNLESHKNVLQDSKLRPLTLTLENSDTVKDTVYPNERNENFTDRGKISNASIYLNPHISILKQDKLRALTLTAENFEIVKDKVSPNEHLIDNNKQAKLRPLTLTLENSEIITDAIGPNESNKHLIVRRESSDTGLNLELYKIVPQQAKLRPLKFIAENSEIVKDKLSSYGRNEYSIDREESSDKAIHLDPQKTVVQEAKLRPLTLTAENSEIVNNKVGPNGEKTYTITNLELQKINHQPAKLRPLSLTAENSEIVKDASDPNGYNKHSIDMGKKSDTVINLELNKNNSQQAKLRPLTLTAENSENIKETVNPNKGNEYSTVLGEKSGTAINVDAHKIIPEVAKLRPLTLSLENSEIINTKITQISRRRRAIRNSHDKYSRNLDFDFNDKNNFHKRYFYPKHEDVEILPPPNFPTNPHRSGGYYFGRPPGRPSRHFYKPPYSRRPYFSPRNFYEDDYVEMITESDFPPTSRPRFSGSPRDDVFTCGREGRRDRNRIIGGIPVALGEYPWMVLLQYSNNNGIKNGCGGSLINSRYILTAAHCVDDEVLKLRKIKLFRVILGEFDTSRDPDCVSSPESTECAESSRIYGISNVLKHSSFDRINAVNDIALVQLDREVIFSDYIKPICLPPSNLNHNNESVMVAGWGRTKVGGTYSQVLNKAVLPVVDQEVCNRLGVTLTSGQICLGLGNGIDTCTGDSGGAIMIQRMENIEVVTYQYGIISYGFASEECGKAPSVNTFVPFYLKWIYSTLSSADY